MDLNPDTRDSLQKSVTFHEQDCSQAWPLKSDSIDLIFTSNFFEHLPNKESLDKTVAHAKTALKPGGLLIALGPNISVLNGRYWDFGIIRPFPISRSENCSKSTVFRSKNRFRDFYLITW